MTPAEKRAYGGLLLSCAGAGEMVLGVRPIHWFNSIVRLGVMVPMFVVHDIGGALQGVDGAMGIGRQQQHVRVRVILCGELHLRQHRLTLGVIAGPAAGQHQLQSGGE